MPRIHISYPISSPAVLSKMRRHVLYIGTGAGIATFLSFVDRQYIKATRLNKDPTEGPRKPDPPESEKANLVFVSRELEHMRWMAKYIDGVLRIPEMTRKMRFHIYITIKPESNNLASFLFWRALTLYTRKLEKDRHKESSLFIYLGRPNFEKLIEEV